MANIRKHRLGLPRHLSDYSKTWKNTCARKSTYCFQSCRLAVAGHSVADRLTTGAVADAIGLTQPAIFRHFPTKQAQWAAGGKDPPTDEFIMASRAGCSNCPGGSNCCGD